MPCWEVRNVEVQFKVGNIDLLKKALEKAGFRIRSANDAGITIQGINYGNATINFGQEKLVSSDFAEKALDQMANLIKRSYSAVVIDEVARRQKWIKREMGSGNYQLQRF